MYCLFIFFFKQKTAYEMRISDWSPDVCSSDLANHYEVDSNHWAGVSGYEMFAKMLGNMRKLANPDNLGPFMGMNLFGTPDTVARRLEQQIGRASCRERVCQYV